eukprot:8213988-Pyramimonas_sp.AAC.1
MSSRCVAWSCEAPVLRLCALLVIAFECSACVALLGVAGHCFALRSRLGDRHPSPSFFRAHLGCGLARRGSSPRLRSR